MRRYLLIFLLVGACYGQAVAEPSAASWLQNMPFVAFNGVVGEAIGLLVTENGYTFDISKGVLATHAVVIQVDSRTKLTIDGHAEETCHILEITHEMWCEKRQKFSTTELFSKTATWTLERDGESTTIAGDMVFSVLMGVK